MQPRYTRVCPKSDALQMLGKRWTIPLLLELSAGPAHFEQLRKALAPVTAKTLSARLSALVGRGLVVKEAERKPGFGRTTYGLTAQGYTLFPIIRAAMCGGPNAACNGCKGVAACAKLVAGQF
jgi:DNA-binding HxlR family transcriptional regulator